MPPLGVLDPPQANSWADEGGAAARHFYKKPLGGQMRRRGLALLAAAMAVALALLRLRYAPRLPSYALSPALTPDLLDLVSHPPLHRSQPAKDPVLKGLTLQAGSGLSAMSTALTQAPSTLFALATLVLSAEFVSRALVLCRNLKTMKPYWPSNLHAVVFVPADYESRNISHKSLSCCFDRVLALPNVKVRRPSKYEKFHEQYIKLNMWSMVNYTRLLYMDGDVYVVDPWILYELVQTNVSFGACKDFWGRSYAAWFNGGVLLLAPNSTTHQELLDKVDTLPRSKFYFDLSEQGYLSAFFGSSAEVLPEKFNTNMVALKRSPNASDILNRSVVIHFAGNSKPWNVHNGQLVAPYSWWWKNWQNETSGC